MTILDYDPADALTSAEAIEVFLNDAFATGHAGYIAQALGVVARAKGLSAIAAASGMEREDLLRSLGQDGDPSLASTLAVLKAVGFEIVGRCGPTAA